MVRPRCLRPRLQGFHYASPELRFSAQVVCLLRRSSGCGHDYEYAGFNPIPYDIANHFCEMTADYHTDTPHVLDYSKYPDLDEQKKFVEIYLKSSGEEPTKEEIENLLESIEQYTLASHLLWGLWGIISEHVNEIDFDYMEYARQRLEQYWLKKRAILESQPL